MSLNEQLLERIAIALEGIRAEIAGIRESTNPLNELTEWTENSGCRVEYTDENREIVEYKLRQMGKEYKERK